MKLQGYVVTVVVAALVLFPSRTSRTATDGAPPGRQVASTASLDRWRLVGPAIPDRLGHSALRLTTDDLPGGHDAALEIAADFANPTRAWVGARYDGPAIAGRCRRLTFHVWSGGASAALRLMLEDSLGAWFEHEVTVPAPAGWHALDVDVGSGSGWSPVLRSGDVARPMQHPVALRQIRVRRPNANHETTVVIRLAGLMAETDTAALDLVRAEIVTGRPGNLFSSGETPSLELRVSNPSGSPFRASLTLSVAAFPESAWDRADSAAPGVLKPISIARRWASVDLGSVTVAPGGTWVRRVACPTSVYAPHEVVLSARDAARQRHWLSRFAYARSSDVPNRQSRTRIRSGQSSPSRFGICGNTGGFRGDLGAVAARLNRIGGSGWARIGLAWPQVNPAPNVWTWDRPNPIQGPLGLALRTAGRAHRAAHHPAQSCPDELTLAFWARVAGPNGMDQVAVRKWGTGDRRNYGAYFDRQTGAFTFSAAYQNLPGDIANISAGTSAFDGQWHHYAATYSRHIRSVCLYVDGALATTAEHDGGRLRTTASELVLGQDLAGDLDEVMIYNRALGPADVAALARKADPPKDGLVVWYDFDDAARIGRNRAAPLSGAPDLVPDEPDGIRSARTAASQGMAALAILGFPAPWASSRPDAGLFWLHEPEPNAWRNYVQAAVGRYRDLIRHWEIWNEPNTEAFWRPRPDPEHYLNLLKIAYGAAKRGNPRSVVLMPALRGPSGPGVSDARAYLDRLLALGAAKHCDAISVHPYRPGTPEETDLVGDLRWIARRCALSGTRRPIWITEMGWPTDTPNGVTPRTQAAMLARSYLLAASTGLVQRFFWYRLHDSGSDRTDPEDNYGLCEEDMTPKPAFFAHRTMAVLLGDASPDGELAVGAGVKVLRFRSPTERFAAVWHPRGSEWVAFQVGKPRVVMTDLMGNSYFSPSPHGVLLVEANDLPVFLRGLSPGVTGQADLVTPVGPTPALTLPAERTALAPAGTLRLRVRNPYPVPIQASLTVRGARGLDVHTPSLQVSLPANGIGEAAIGVRAARTAEPGSYPLTIAVRFPGGTVTTRVDLIVRTSGMPTSVTGRERKD